MKSQTIPELLSAREIEQDQAAIIEFGRDSIENTSRKEIFQQSDQLSSGLLKAGLEHGDRVVVMAPNSSDWVVSALGVMFSGAVIVPIDTQMPGEDLDHVLADCDPRFIFTTSTGSAGSTRTRGAGMDQGNMGTDAPGTVAAPTGKSRNSFRRTHKT